MMRFKIAGGMVAVLVAALAASQPASATHETGDWPPEGGIGVKVYSTGEPLVVEVMAASAAYTSNLYLASPGPRTLIASNRDVGDIVTVGTFAADTELVFEIDVLDTGFTYSTGPGDRNPDGAEHAAAMAHEDGTVVVGFEDEILEQSDMDYDDNVFNFEGGLTVTAPPEPTKLVAEPLVLDVLNPSVELPLEFSATLTLDPSGTPVAGKTIVFKATTTLLGDGAEICTAVTGTDGVATCGAPESVIPGILGLGYDASWAGDSTHLAASDHAPIIRVATVEVL